MCFHASASQVEIDAGFGIDEGARISDNLDDTTAVLTNKAGMSVKIMPWLLSKGTSIPQPFSDFIAVGWSYAKSKGVPMPLQPSQETTSSGLRALEDGEITSSIAAASTSTPSPMALADEPAEKKAKVDTSIGSVEPQGTLSEF